MVVVCVHVPVPVACDGCCVCACKVLFHNWWWPTATACILLRTVSTHLQDVVLTTGCIGAFDLALTSIAGPGDNILIPQPCFPGYNMTLGALEVEGRQYKLVVSSCRDNSSE